MEVRSLIIHVWIGLTRLDAGAFSRYFEQDVSGVPGGRAVSRFAQDLNVVWPDDDWTGVQFWEGAVTLAAALDELPVSSGMLGVIQAQGEARDITRVNALIYSQEDLPPPDPARLYGGLSYLGAFEDG